MENNIEASIFYFKLQRLRQEIEDAGFNICCSWMNEYGGEQRVTLGPPDRLLVSKKI